MRYLILLVIFVLTTSYSQTNFIIRDNFSNNSSSWKLESTGEYTSVIEKGVLRVSTNFDRAYFLNREFNHTSNNYKVKFKFKWVSGSNNNAFGVSLGNALNSHKYLFTSNGYTTIIKERYDLNSNADWQTTTVKPDWNEVVIYRFDNKHIIYLNNKPVLAKYLENIFTSYFTFIVENKQVVEFDDLEVSYLDNKDKEKFVKEDKSAARTNQLLNNNQNFSFSFTDDFSEDISFWRSGSIYEKINVANGILTFDKGENSRSTGTAFQSFPLGSEFTISCKTIWNSGENEGYGIGWGGNTKGECSSFLISQGGYYGITTENEGFTGWTLSDAINKKGTNLLKISSSLGQVSYYINNQLVHSTGHIPVINHLAGLVVMGKQNVSFDDFFINNKEIDAFEKTTTNSIKFPSFFSILENESFSTYYDDSYFRIEHKKTEGNGIIGLKELTSGKDFKISTKLIHEESDEDPDKEFIYGLIFNFKDWDNYYELIISNYSFFKVRIKSLGVEYSTDWTITDLGYDGTLVLGVEKHEDLVYYFINNKQVFTTPFYGNLGNNHGVVSYKDQVIRVYDFQINEYQPDLYDMKPEIRNLFR